MPIDHGHFELLIVYLHVYIQNILVQQGNIINAFSTTGIEPVLNVQDMSKPSYCVICVALFTFDSYKRPNRSQLCVSFSHNQTPNN